MSSSKMNDYIGSNDSSVDSITEDLFEITQYVKGLSRFIGKCVTPMTISIQGDWGSGKTSIMNMVKENLGDNVIPIWFNTWQYSQFDLGKDLPLSLLGRLIKALKPELSKGAKAYDTLRMTYKAVKKVGRVAVDQFIGDYAGKTIDILADSFAEGKDEQADAIDNLKNTFQDCVDNAIVRDKKDRVVIFIDDLDRLNPVRAVELLEVMKIFLDCKHCVFVLAIDYSVVSTGVKQKYGDLIGADKGRRFFDKIIQVPFKVPVAHYQVRKYVIEMFRQVDITFRTEKEADVYVDLIQCSVGCNPRTMKRLFNAYILLMCIGEDVNITAKLEDPEEGPWYRKLLFAVLCCQHAYEELYNFLVRNKSEILKAEVLEELKNPESYRPFEAESNMETQSDEGTQDEIVLELQEKFKNASGDLISRMAEFMEMFVSVIDRSGDRMLDEEKELAAVEDIFSISAITMAGNEEVTEQRTARGSRIISDVDDLDMGSMTNDQKTEISEFLQSLGDDVKVLYVQGKFSHIAAKTKNGNGTTFADVYGLKKGYRIDIYSPKAGLLKGWKKMPEIGDWVRKHGLTPANKSTHKNRVSPKIFNEEDAASVKQFLTMMYQAWQKYDSK